MTKVLAETIGDDWALYHADCVEGVKGLPDESIHYSIFSPPFASLYTYSASSRDMGNCADDEEFARHFQFLVEELLRVIRAGRLCSFHCMNIPASKTRDGYIGLKDFRGDLIRAFQAAGWIFHSEVVIWKDPVTAMQRTKSLGLLHKTIRTNASRSRQGIPDYLVTMRKPGDDQDPIAHVGDDEMPVRMWQKYASPVWATLTQPDPDGFYDIVGDTDDENDGTINPSDTLQFRSAREHDDERHICPLQLSVIRRAIKLWTAPGDTVLSPFAGIGSEGYVALNEGRKFVGLELKSSYYAQAARNLSAVGSQMALF